MRTRKAIWLLKTALALLLSACASAPPESDYRLDSRAHTACHAIAVAPTGDFFAALCDVLVKDSLSGRDYNETVELIRIPDGTLIQKTVLNMVENILGPQMVLSEIEISRDGSRIALISGSGKYQVLETASLSPVVSVDVVEARATALSFTGEGDHIAVAFAATTPEEPSYVAIFRAADNIEIARLPTSSIHPISSIATSEDGTFLAIATIEQSVSIVRVYKDLNQLWAKPIRHDETVKSILFLDESRLATLSDDLKVFEFVDAEDDVAHYRLLASELVTPGIWSTEYAEVPRAKGFNDPVPRMKLSPNRKVIAVADMTNAVRLIDLNSFEITCSVHTGEITELGQSTLPPGLAARTMMFPSDLDWLPDGSMIAGTFAISGMHLIGAGCIDDDVNYCAGLNLLPGDHVVEMDDEHKAILAEVIDRNFFESEIFQRGDSLNGTYRVIEFDEGNKAVWFLTNLEGTNVRISATFRDPSGAVLLDTQAEAGQDYNPYVDTLGEGMSGGVTIPFRRASEALAYRAALRFGCLTD